MKTLLTMFFCLLPLFIYCQAIDSSATLGQIDSLIKLSRALTDQKQYNIALQNVEAAEKRAYDLLGNQHPIYATCIFNHGRVFHFKGNPALGIEFYLQAQAIWEGIQQTSTYPDYTSCLLNLANLYSEQGQPEKAEPLYLRVKSIREISPGKYHPGYTRVLASLGNLYVDMSRFEDAEALLQEAKDLQFGAFGVLSREYGNTLNNLGHLYYESGQYFNAETCLLEAKDIYGAILGKNHFEYAQVLNNLANAYTQLRLFKKAESCQLEALSILGNILGKKYPLYATWLANLAHLYHQNAGYPKAEQLYLEAKALQEGILEKNHPDYLNTINNLAVLYQETGFFVKAEPLLDEVKEARLHSYGVNHLLYGAALLNLGRLYIVMKRFEDARIVLEQSNNIIEKSAGKNHLFYQNVLESQVNLFFATGKKARAWPLLETYMNLRRNQLLQASKYLSGQQLSEYFQQFEQNLNFFIEYGIQSASDRDQLAAAVMEHILFYKGLMLQKSDHLKHLTSSNPDAAHLYELLLACHRRLAKAYANPAFEHKNIKVLEEQAYALEKDLTRSVAGYSAFIRQVGWQEVQAALEPGEIAIEFVHFRFSNPNTRDSVLYAALVLRPDGKKPAWITLCEEEQLAVLLDKQTADNPETIDRMYGSDALYSFIWQPLEKYLSGAPKVIFSPSGLLHLLAFEAVLPFSNSITVHRLGSTRQLVLDEHDTAISGRYALVYGGIQYEMDSLSMASANQVNDEETITAQPGKDRAAIHNPGQTGAPWSYLTWTEVEAQNVAELLTTAGIHAIVKKGFAATEESVYAIDKKNTPPKVLHFATHGFSFPDPLLSGSPKRASNEPVFKVSPYPLMRSGLALAGANNAWTGGKPLQRLEDGILTAYEISQLNLEGTELVVLSACETGLGKIEGNEGIYGLQRAFKMAGAKYVLMSLWQVSDYETEELMDVFYTEWLVGHKSIPEAFRNAQSKVRANHPEPFYWAGFILIE